LTSMSAKPVILGLGPYPYSTYISDKFDKVLFTTHVHSNSLDPATKKQYLHIEAFDNYDLTGMIEFRALELHKKHAFSRVVCLAEEDILRAARIRKVLKIPGQTEESALTFRDKVIMKDLIKAKGLNVPIYQVVDSALDIISFLEKHGHHAVIKPKRGFGAVGVSIIKSEEDLKKYFSSGKMSDMCDGILDLEIETFVSGPMYHVDGVVANKELKVIWPSEYVGAVGNFQSNNFIAAASLHPKDPLTKRIQLFVKTCLESLDAPDGYSFHAEVWHTPDDKLVFCEVGCRPGGGGIPDQFLNLLGVSLHKSAAQIQCEDSITGPLTESWDKRAPPEMLLAWIFVYPKIGTLTEIPKNCPLPEVLSFEVFGHPGSKFESRAHCADLLASFLVTSEQFDDLKKKVHSTYEWFDKNTKYSTEQ